MKSPEELNALKNEVETLNKKLAELTVDDLAQISGGKLDREAARWIAKNISEVYTRAHRKGIGTDIGKLISLIFNMTHVYTLEELKQTLGVLVKVDDLL